MEQLDNGTLSSQVGCTWYGLRINVDLDSLIPTTQFTLTQSCPISNERLDKRACILRHLGLID